MDKARDANGNPEVLWMRPHAVKIAESGQQGDGPDYILGDLHRKRIGDLIDANNEQLFISRAETQKLIIFAQKIKKYTEQYGVNALELIHETACMILEKNPTEKIE